MELMATPKATPCSLSLINVESMTGSFANSTSTVDRLMLKLPLTVLHSSNGFYAVPDFDQF